ncbi:Polyol transporter 5 [Triticum urartu]|uniref:Polyol transporter 5 n=1 Tax=Triticum urartu TaxID=4572 RepID=M8AKR7_TRIUA|nr:Polyol transporter 5 [Triticum urartu]
MASDGLPEAVAPKTKKSNIKYASTCAVVASMASIVLGYDIGVMSGASLYIQKDLEITDVQSPRWLVMKGRLADARVVLEKITDTPEEAEERLADIKTAAGIPEDLDGDVVVVPRKRGGEEKQVWRELILSPTPSMRRMLLAALGVFLFQQLTGSDSVVLYSPRVFESAGITGDDQLLAATCAMGVAKTLVILVAMFLLDRVGRRPLLLCSTGGMIVSLVGLATGLTVVDQNPDARVPWAVSLCVASVLAYVSFFSVGLGPVTGVYTTEILPLRVRALGFAVGAAGNRVVSGVMSMAFLSLSGAITLGGTFFLYAGVAVLAWVFFFTCLPETRGRTLEEMGSLFGMTDTGPEAEDAAPGTQDASCRARLLINHMNIWGSVHRKVCVGHI